MLLIKLLVRGGKRRKMCNENIRNGWKYAEKRREISSRYFESGVFGFITKILKLTGTVYFKSIRVVFYFFRYIEQENGFGQSLPFSIKKSLTLLFKIQTRKSSCACLCNIVARSGNLFSTNKNYIHNCHISYRYIWFFICFLFVALLEFMSATPHHAAYSCLLNYHLSSFVRSHILSSKSPSTASNHLFS